MAVLGIGALMAVFCGKRPHALDVRFVFSEWVYGAVAPLIPSITADIFLGKKFWEDFRHHRHRRWDRRGRWIIRKRAHAGFVRFLCYPVFDLHCF